MIDILNMFRYFFIQVNHLTTGTYIITYLLDIKAIMNLNIFNNKIEIRIQNYLLLQQSRIIKLMFLTNDKHILSRIIHTFKYLHICTIITTLQY